MNRKRIQRIVRKYNIICSIHKANTYKHLAKVTQEHNIDQSMSRKCNYWDNAPHKSFFIHMKDEIDYRSGNTLCELQVMVDDYMDYYNN